MATTYETRFNVRFRSNIQAHRKWFEWLSGSQFFETTKEKYQSAANIGQMHKIAQKVIEEEIYNKHSASRGRTYSLLDSFIAAPNGGDGTANITVYSDPVVAPSKGPFSTGNPDEFSYAAFFEEPVYNSFLLGTGVDVYNPAKFRPFMEPLERAVEEEAREASMRALYQAIQKKMPRKTQ